jgi:ELWxxDGT repeat protein
LGVANASARGLLVDHNPDFTVVGARVLFNGLDRNGQTGLWITDGTAAGTSEIAPSASFASGSGSARSPSW